ncbi:low temperature requirement protein A [soil metagenome]
MSMIKNSLSSRFLTAESGKEGDRVTTLELFFDLIYVFAFTQVSLLMAHGSHGTADATGVLQGLVVLGLVWWSWTSYAWLGNQAHADRGIVRVGVMVAIATMFVVTLAIPEAFADHEGGLFAPIVFAVGYIFVRVVHSVVYIIAAGADAGLRRQVIVSLGIGLVPSAALLIIGAFVGAPYQVWIWLVAIALDLLIVYLSSSDGDWRLPSAAHFAERHGLIIILALGESIVAIGVGAAQLPLSVGIIVGSVLGVALALGLWWTYFHSLSTKVEREVAKVQGTRRATVATGAYTYLHIALVAGIVITAVGIEQVMREVESPEPIGRFTAIALAGGVSLYLAGTAFVWRRVSGEWAIVRLAGATVIGLSTLLLNRLPALGAIAVTVVLVVALIVVEQILGQRAKAPSRAATVAQSKPKTVVKPAPTIPQPAAPSARRETSDSPATPQRESSITGLLDRDDT